MRYPFKVYYAKVEDHEFWIAECEALNGCVGQGDTLEEALEELELNQNEWLKTAEEYNLSIPDIPVENCIEYSGKFTVRVAPFVHQEAVVEAKKQGISLNQYVNNAIVAQNSSLKVTGYIAPNIKRIIDSISLLSKSSQLYSTKNSIDKNIYRFNESKFASI